MSDVHFSFKWLVTYRTLAQCGSIQKAAQITGQSISTVSLHLQHLEAHLGVDLLDHTTRPMVLTAKGVVYLRYAEDVLELLEQANGDVKASAPNTLSHLRFAMIDDFESDIGPDITRLLASLLPNCKFTLYTRDSHEILTMLRDRSVDIAIATQPQSPLANVREYPLLRDPFVLAVPAGTSHSAADFVNGQTELPFLRYMRTQIMGGMIEAQLNRLRLNLENSFELDSTTAMMSLIARSGGWAITTPSTYARAKRFHTQVALLPLPIKDFARTVSVFAVDPHLDDLTQNVQTSLRTHLTAHTLNPLVGHYPWLANKYRLVTH